MLFYTGQQTKGRRPASCLLTQTGQLTRSYFVLDQQTKGRRAARKTEQQTVV